MIMSSLLFGVALGAKFFGARAFSRFFTGSYLLLLARLCHSFLSLVRSYNSSEPSL